MTQETLRERLTQVVRQQLPLPGAGNTTERLRILAKTAREDLTLAKVAEAHWDAVAILAEAGRTATPDALYAVWASEGPGQALELLPNAVDGSKAFCSGIDIVDRALITVALPQPHLVEIDIRNNARTMTTDLAPWKVQAFRETHTGTINFHETPIAPGSVVGKAAWYTNRPGFWHGACGPAACWAGGIAGLVDAAAASRRQDPHTLAHLGALHANVWAMFSLLDQAAREIDQSPDDLAAAQIRALKLRHLIEHLSTDILRRFARAYGPSPLSMNESTARRYHEADLYLRQSHAERDLETLGRLSRS